MYFTLKYSIIRCQVVNSLLISLFNCLQSEFGSFFFILKLCNFLSISIVLIFWVEGSAKVLANYYYDMVWLT